MRVGCLGGGQLGRMLALAGLPLGLRFAFLEPAPTAPASDLGLQLLGAYDDPRLLRRLREESDLVTFEFESVPASSAQLLSESGVVFPSAKALRVGQDRLLEKQLFSALGIETAAFCPIATAEDLGEARELGFPARLKTRRLGYDGKGQRLVESPSELDLAWEELGRVPAILERQVPFQRELSILSVRGRDGETAVYPLVENHHEQGILRLTLAPAPGLTKELELAAAALSALVLEELEYVGVLAVELFQVQGRLLANEIAPRVHNSGHWSIDGAHCSQFENHLRAGLGWPLGPTSAVGYTAMLNLLGELPEPEEVLALPGAHLHLYAKERRPGRKLGHVNVTGDDPAQVTSQVRALARSLRVELEQPQASDTGDSYWGRGQQAG
ncbi:MAG: 5-(carboxyamino)imidazole ribonucleotide synthase [Candidatus Dormibacteria bacterium]